MLTKVLLAQENLKTEAGSHIVFLYRDKSELIEFLPEYYCAGFKCNEVCFLVVDNDALANSIKTEILGKNIINESQMAEKLSLVDYQKLYFSVEPFDANEIFRKVDDMIENNRGVGIRTCGDMTWVNKSNFDDFFQYECGLSERYGKKNLILMCAYCIKDLDAQQLLQMMQAHTKVLSKHKGVWRITPGIDKEIYEEKLQELEDSGIGNPNITDIREQIRQIEKQLKDE